MQKLSQSSKQDRQKGKPKQIYETCQSDEESLKVSDEEMDRAIGTIVAKSFNLNSVQSVIETTVETGRIQKVLLWKKSRYRQWWQSNACFQKQHWHN